MMIAQKTTSQVITHYFILKNKRKSINIHSIENTEESVGTASIRPAVPAVRKYFFHR